jgi:glycosyltransferase involved in cell wall biosynthesis
MPTVSIIIPFLSRGKWLHEAVHSVFAQTYQDFEVILVGDGSSEGLDELAGLRDERIRYVRQQNKGPSAARNAGLDSARGRYIAFLDADDIFWPMKLEKQVSCMEENPNIMLSHTSYQLMSSDGKYIRDVKAGRFSGRVYPKIMVNCPIQTSNVMIRSEAVLENLRFEEDARVGEDIILWIQISRKSLILGIDEPLTSVRIHGNNAAFSPQAQIIGLMNIIEYTIRRNPDLPFVFRQEALSSFYLNIGYNYLRKNEKSQFLRFLVRAVATWPLNCRLYASLAKNSLLFIKDRVLPNRDKDKYHINDRSRIDKPGE